MNEEIADALCKANIISFGSYQLASGKESSIYVNLKMLPSYPDALNLISDKIAEQMGNLGADIIAGSEPGGVPLAVAVSLKTGIPMISVRKPSKFPRGSNITGNLGNGQKVVLVTDLITNGYNKLRIIENIKKEGGAVENIISVLDKEEGAAESLHNEGVQLHSLITLKSLLEYMRDHSLIEKEKYLKILNELEAPGQDYG